MENISMEPAVLKDWQSPELIDLDLRTTEAKLPYVVEESSYRGPLAS